ncbi:MAG: SLBB domain-containing protein, partial [Candidatus Sericytochromatia bacterium]|nr:SLBB domain-containing protein [Candidatus Sericytochromatia bacterium]
MYQKLVKNIIASTLFVSLSILITPIQVQAYDSNIITVMAKVQVSGAVKKPGIYTVPQGTRLVDLLSKAGGLRKDAVLTDVNMTTPVTDGSNIFIASKNDKINPITKIDIPKDPNLNSKKISKKSSKKSKSKKKDLIKSNQLISLNKATEEELN